MDWRHVRGHHSRSALGPLNADEAMLWVVKSPSSTTVRFMQVENVGSYLMDLLRQC